jgi:hypothetical protein
MTSFLTKSVVQSRLIPISRATWTNLAPIASNNMLCRLPEVIAKHSTGKPIMIFCCTRNAAITTAKELANRWLETNPPRRLWQGGRNQSSIKNLDLQGLFVYFIHIALLQLAIKATV